MPFFKKAGGKIFGCQFNRKEQEAMEHEVRSQLAEWSRKNMMEIDAIRRVDPTAIKFCDEENATLCAWNKNEKERCKNEEK